VEAGLQEDRVAAEAREQVGRETLGRRARRGSRGELADEDGAGETAGKLQW
jgi:hypothetical protein